MARLVLTGKDGTTFEIRPNEMETLEMVATPVMDSTGLEVLYHKIKLDVRAVINPLMLATNQPTVAPPLVPPPGALAPAGLTVATGPGDRAGLTARAISQLMGNPRPLVQYWIGPDLVLEAPNRLDAAGTQFLPCDAMGGPFVRHCRCYEVRGDKTIFLNLSIELATTAYSKILLSNRWRMTADIDSAGFTTRTIDGRAVFRLDGLVQKEAFPDDFRNLLLVPSDSSLRRVRSSFTAEDDNGTYSYHVVDRETAYGTGANSGIEKIEGTVTIHMGTEVLTKKKFGFKLFDWVPGAFKDPLGTLGAFAKTVINVSTVDIRMSCAVRVLGQSGASNANLYNTAMAVFSAKVLGKLVVGGYKFAQESLMATQWIGSEDQPIVEVRSTGIAVAMVALPAMYNAGTLAGFMDLNTGVPAPVGYQTVTPRTTLPNSANTRGNGYTSNIFAQALTAVPSDLPPAPIAPPIAMDVTTEV